MMENGLTIKRLTADVLIIGGGTAGCYAAITIGRRSGRSVLIAEKADIPVNTVKTRISRAKALIIQKMQDMEEEL